MVNPARAWLSEFRLMNLTLRRNLDGKPLYSYQVSQSEYQQLTDLLRKKSNMPSNPVYLPDWAACFCLYVAESFRREYDGNWGWSWDPIWRKLGYELSVQEYQHLVELGLIKWRRPMRYFVRGRNLLGSLFAEGGLPWLLVQTDHSFGVLVRKGLAHYYDTKAIGHSLTTLMSEHGMRLPQSFRTLETYQLLAGIVEQLIYLVEQYPLQHQKDPAAFLDQQKPNWRSEFPIPLDENNARILINEWLNNANEQHQQQNTKAKEIKAIYCTHQLNAYGDAEQWKIKSLIYLPKNIVFTSDCSRLTSTRFDLAFYEGGRLIHKAGIVYAEIDVISSQISITILSQKYELTRHLPHEPLKLVFFQSGVNLHTLLVEDSTLMLGQLPVVFENKDEEWLFLRQASCKIQGRVARINIPENCNIISGTYSIIHALQNGSKWIDFTSDVTLQIGMDRYRIQLQQTIQDAGFRITGEICLYNTTPSLVYHGLPDIRLLEEGEQPQCWSLEINGKPAKLIPKQQTNNFAGLFEYRVLGEEQESLARLKFGVLPPGFMISTYPSSGQQPAKIVITQAQALPITIAEDNISFTKYNTFRGVEIDITTKNEKQQDVVTLLVGSPNSPVRIKLPYPQEGAELIDENQKQVIRTELNLHDLLGLRLNISSASQAQQRATIELALMRNPGVPIKRSFSTSPYQYFMSISLFSYQDEIRQLLSMTDDQDAYVKISIIQSGKPLKQLYIRRYQAVLNQVSSQRFSLEYASSLQQGEDNSIYLCAMRLSNPQQKVEIPAITSHYASTGDFEIPNDLKKEGPWLVYSTCESTTQTRPFLYISPNSDNIQNEALLDVKSLHHAAELFHPTHRPTLIKQQIIQMATNLNHSGWQYLSDLKNNYAHLPLSTFETWRALARQPASLAIGLFRLEFDYAFCERIQQELAIFWDTISIQTWVRAYAEFKTWLLEQGLPTSLVMQVLANREQTLHVIVSGFEFIKTYLQEPIQTNLRPAPLQALLVWYQNLRHRNANDIQWPTDLGHKLRQWINLQPLPHVVKHLSLSEETDAVTYLPIFMAHVSIERATLKDLNFPDDYLKFRISVTANFDRISWYNPVHAMMVCYLLAHH